MKKTLALLAFLMPSFAFATFEFDLSYRSQGEEVIELQEFLTSENLYSGPITGNFFSLTLKGVKDFQVREGITPVSGYFGPKTRARANNILDAAIETSDRAALEETGEVAQPSDNSTKTSLQLQIEELTSQVQKLLQEQQAQTFLQGKILQKTETPSGEVKITSVKINTPTQFAAQYEWTTNIPTRSKVFQTTEGNTGIIESKSGLSTMHSTDILTFAPGTKVSYTIEAMADNSSVKTSDSFSIEEQVPTRVEVIADTESVYGGNCDQVWITAKVKDQHNGSISGQTVSFYDPETKEFIKSVTASEGARFYYKPQEMNTSQQVRVYLGHPPVIPSVMGEATIKLQPEKLQRLLNGGVQINSEGKCK